MAIYSTDTVYIIRNLQNATDPILKNVFRSYMFLPVLLDRCHVIGWWIANLNGRWNYLASAPNEQNMIKRLKSETILNNCFPCIDNISPPTLGGKMHVYYMCSMPKIPAPCLAPLQALVLLELLRKQNLQEEVRPAMVVPGRKERMCMGVNEFQWMCTDLHDCEFSIWRLWTFHDITWQRLTISITLWLTSMISSEEGFYSAVPCKEWLEEGNSYSRTVSL